MIRKISIVVLTLCVAVSCGKQQEKNHATGGNTINLTVDVSTRSTTTSTSNLSEFVCFGYSQGMELWSTVATTATSDLMWNNRYTKNELNWLGDIDIDWPTTQINYYFAFFGYAPIATDSNNLTLITDQTKKGYQRLRYETLPDVENQIDLIIASRPNQHRVSKVPLAFNHALTRIGFQAFTNIANTRINSISINSMFYKGELDIHRDAVWQNVSPDKTNFKVEMIPALAVSLEEAKPTDLSLNGNYCFNLLPQDLSANIDNTTCITIDYTQNGVQYTKNYTIKENLAKGHFTIYKVNLNGDPNTDLIVSQVIITDWVFDSQDDMDTNDGTQKYEEFTATYNANGGSGVPSPEQIPANKKLKIGAAPTATPTVDHLFLGYNTMADGSGTTYLPGAEISLTEDLTLYATWDTNFVIIDNLKWAKGNLVKAGVNKCKIGKPEDAGIYFQFGSLIGWKGGSTGDGVGRSDLGNGVFYGGASFSATAESSIYPTVFTGISGVTVWPVDATNTYYFGSNGVYSTNYDLKEFSGYLSGSLATTSKTVGDPCRYYVGNGWRQPTIQEVQALYDVAENTNWIGDWWISSTNSYMICTFADGVKIQLPAVGYREIDGRLSNNGLNCYYGTSSVYDGSSQQYLFGAHSTLDPRADYLRQAAMPMRCVKDIN